MKIVNPATEKVIADLSEDTAASVADAYVRARHVQPAWSRAPLATRLDVVRRFKELLAARRDELALDAHARDGQAHHAGAATS